MNLHERQQFDFLLYTATERFVERLEQRNGGPEAALINLRQNADGDGVWLNDFTSAIFTDFLLDNVEGACFVLQSLAKRSVAVPSEGTIETMLIAMAKTVFAKLLCQKTEEALEQRGSYQPTGGSQ